MKQERESLETEQQTLQEGPLQAFSNSPRLFTGLPEIPIGKESSEVTVSWVHAFGKAPNSERSKSTKYFDSG